MVRYRQVLAVPGMAPLLGVSLFARTAITADVMALTLYTVLGLDRSYAAAGQHLLRIHSPEHRLTAEQVVKRLQVRIPWVMAASATMFTKGRKDIYEHIRTRPDWTYIALLFDGKYPLAAALAERRLTWHEYDRGVIFDEVVQALIDRVELVPDLTVGVFGAEAELELADGRTFVSRQDCIEEFPVIEKLQIGAEGLLSSRQIRRIARAVDHVEGYDDVRDFMRIVAPR